MFTNDPIKFNKETNKDKALLCLDPGTKNIGIAVSDINKKVSILNVIWLSEIIISICFSSSTPCNILLSYGLMDWFMYRFFDVWDY